MEKKRRKSGITLIALAITIVVLLILAGVTITFVLGEDGLIAKAREAQKESANAVKNDQSQLDDVADFLNGYTQSESGYNETDKVNSPNLKKGMIPVYYDDASKVWRKADENNKDKQWYNYDEKKWANIVTVAEENGELRNVAVGTEIPMDKITTFFVWVPRYAYSITSGYKQGNGATGSIDVTFLKGNTNIGTDGVSYPTDYDESKLSEGATTPKIVHPGFKLGDRELTGIWVAKFEASGTDSNGNAVGNASAGSSAEQYQPDSSTYVKILPSKISWRHITIGESEYRSMQMSNNTDKYGWNSTVNSHLIKNNEWGAVAYLCYSKYGSIPKTNGANIEVVGSHRYDLYTGAGPKDASSEGQYVFSEETHAYNTDLGVLASTTGNVYGIYDMAGGAWDRVAAYLDNGNGNLNNYGKSKDNSVKYFENGVLNAQYSSLWNTYQVSDEEKSNKINVEGVGTVTQTQLWNWNNKSIEYNTARLRLTQANYNNMARYKGIGVNETGNKFSYYAPYGTDSVKKLYNWFNTVKNTETDTTAYLERTWSGDYTLIGHASGPFVMRGGYCSDGAGAGVLCTNIASGYANYFNGFRPVLAF